MALNMDAKRPLIKATDVPGEGSVIFVVSSKLLRRKPEYALKFGGAHKIPDVDLEIIVAEVDADESCYLIPAYFWDEASSRLAQHLQQQATT